MEEKLKQDRRERIAMWSEFIAVGSQEFVENTQRELGILAKGRNCEVAGESFQLKEENVFYHFDPKMEL